MFCNKRKKIAYVIGHRSSEEYRDRNLNVTCIIV